ncbi:hypothetical protein KUTeg_023868 [Tegillarca granosa]|uniref:Uncharacterized protein n=1 Tax=Tegillarca granosa TaxID=220873 RepID=A0ABQ9E2Y9_TEGGR|nr:hypothetical protein KUTeg_023868 [Tegillarca granosa]
MLWPEARMEGTSKINQGSRPLTPVDYNKQKLSPAKNKNPPTQVSPTVQRESPVVTPVSVEKGIRCMYKYIPL